MGAIMMLAFLTVIGNLIADIMYGMLDPRVRLD
jgi:peptide/nickel transport system permease protein